jgi:hypothetical protein
MISVRLRLLNPSKGEGVTSQCSNDVCTHIVENHMVSCATVDPGCNIASFPQKFYSSGLQDTSFSVKALLRRSSRSEGFDTPSATQPDGDVSRPSVSLENAAHWVSILISIRLRLLNPSRYSAGLSSRRHIEINRRSLTEKLVFRKHYQHVSLPSSSRVCVTFPFCLWNVEL